MTATQNERDDAYRAVGRYVVEFSRMIFFMRLGLEGELFGGNRVLIDQLFEKASADKIRRLFFAVCKDKAKPDKSEKKIVDRLEARVRREVRRRNEFAHGDWWIGFGRKDDGTAGDPLVGRLSQTKGGLKELPVAEIDQISSAVYELRQLVAEFGDICLGHWAVKVSADSPARIGDIFTLTDGVILRDGPMIRSSRIGVIRYS